MHRFTRRPILPVLLALLCCACDSSDDDEEQPPQPPPPAAPQRGDPIGAAPLLVASYSPDELLALAGSNEVAQRLVEEVLTPIDPLSRIGDAKGEILLQAGRSDSVVPPAALRALADAAPDGTQLRWYDAEHDLNDRARRDQLDWLTASLGLDGS